MKASEFDIHLCAELIAKVAFQVFESEDEKVTSFLSLGKVKQKMDEVYLDDALCDAEVL